MPLEFVNPEDYDKIDLNDEIEIPNAREQLVACVKEGKPIKVINKTKGVEIETKVNITPRQLELLLAGGLLNYIKQKQQQNKSA
jgi:aconitate hydratase